MTPETQGGMFHGQFEMQYTRAQQATLITDNDRVDEGVIYTSVPRTGYMFSNSFFEALDFVLSHTASGNSMAGGKLQFYGTSRTAKSSGHKLSGVFLVGGNEHETSDKSVKFRLDGQEFLLIYGYRINEAFLPYISLGSATYLWTAEISSPYPALNGAEPHLKSEAKSCNIGVEGELQAFFGKAELSYQELKTSETNNKASFNLGVAVGVNW